MESLTTIISIAASLFAGTSIYQFFSLRTMKKKMSAEADQEGAKAEGLNLNNVKEFVAFLREQTTMSEARNGQLSAENDILRQKLRGIEENFETFKKANEYQIGVLTRKVSGLEKVVSREIVRREYAERHICLNLECKERVPELGHYSSENN